VLNYLVRLGWSHDDQEVFSIDEMQRLFDVGDVHKAASRFDTEKLAWLNQQYLKNDDPESLAPEFRWHLERAGIDVAAGPDPAAVIVALRERVHTLKEMAERARIWYAPISEWDPKAVKKHLGSATAPAVLEAAREALQNLPTWAPEPIHEMVREVSEKLELGMGKIAQPLRVAMTGTQVSPSIEDTIYLCGRDTALARIDEALKRIATA
jgi:glutamyl-tRNA synthetase